MNYIFISPKITEKCAPSIGCFIHIVTFNSNHVCSVFWYQSTGDIGTTFTHFWKLFHYRVNREHYDKSIGIREFIEQISHDFFKNTFLTDFGNPDNIIPLLDGLDEKIWLILIVVLIFLLPYLVLQKKSLIMI